jgi:hypothetical protein
VMMPAPAIEVTRQSPNTSAEQRQIDFTVLPPQFADN